MFCKNCGNQISEDSLFCAKCGTKVQPFGEKTSALLNANNKPANHSKSKRKTIVIIVLVIAGII